MLGFPVRLSRRISFLKTLINVFAHSDVRFPGQFDRALRLVLVRPISTGFITVATRSIRTPTSAPRFLFTSMCSEQLNRGPMAIMKRWSLALNIFAILSMLVSIASF